MYCMHRVVQLTVSLLTHTGPLLVCNKDSNACITLGGFTGRLAFYDVGTWHALAVKISVVHIDCT